ncbi:hypothetical protein CPB97_004923 [Podila verticillata]|nr:hypothetical protein CPB97_004923 [Podila verticillata]
MADVVPTLDAIAGFDAILHVEKSGLERGYGLASTGIGLFFNGESAIASKFFTKSISILKAALSKDQLEYLFTDFLFRHICSVCVCTPQDLAAISNNNDLKMFFIAYVDASPLVPLDTSPADGSTAIPEPAFKNLLTALVKGDVAGADTMAGQLTSDQVNAIQYAAKAMGVYLGIDLGYQHPRGLFALCIEGFSDKIPATVNEITGFVSKVFGDAALFHDLYKMHRKNTPPL